MIREQISQKSTFNRTILELKRRNHLTDLRLSVTFNRTILELKLQAVHVRRVNHISFYPDKKQKSLSIIH